MINISQKIQELSDTAAEKSVESFKRIDAVTQLNQRRVLASFIDNRVSESHFAASTGYGYGDRGKQVLYSTWANALGAEDAIVSYDFASGTHTLSVMLFGMLRPGDTLLCLNGMPYDTILPVMGLSQGSTGSLKEYGITVKCVDLLADGSADLCGIKESVAQLKPAAVYIQRSRGYTLRPSLTNEKIAEIVSSVRCVNGGVPILLDNCYGEFTETSTPFEAGADICAGSLIKNAGGGIARRGGYIAGKSEYVNRCSYRLTCPGLGSEVGATLESKREIFMGLFHAPHVTGEAMKAAVFASALFTELGYECSPRPEDARADIIESILLGSEKKLIAFCRGLQSGSAVDSFVTPEPCAMPGYDSRVIMAAGAFTLGSSIELSADAPLREPYAVWMQGGLNFHSARAGLELAAQAVLDC